MRDTIIIYQGTYIFCTNHIHLFTQLDAPHDSNIEEVDKPSNIATLSTDEGKLCD